MGGINVIDDLHTPGHKPPRVDFAVIIEGPLLASIVYTMQRVWAIVEMSQLRSSDVPLFPSPARVERVGTQTAKFVIRDNLRHRRDIERSYLAAIRQQDYDTLSRRPALSAAQKGGLIAAAIMAQAGQLLSRGARA